MCIRSGDGKKSLTIYACVGIVVVGVLLTSVANVLQQLSQITFEISYDHGDGNNATTSIAAPTIRSYLLQTSLWLVAIETYVFGIFILVTAFGLLALATSNKNLLVAYELLMIVVCAVHLACLTYECAYDMVDMHQEIASRFNDTLSLLDRTMPTPEMVDVAARSRFSIACDDMRSISSYFQCSCSLANSTVEKLCCTSPMANLNAPLCVDQVRYELDTGIDLFFFVPNAVLIVTQLALILLVPLVARRIARRTFLRLYDTNITAPSNYQQDILY